MDTPFAAPLPFEVLDGVRDVNVVALDPRLLECAIEKFAGRPDKWFSGQVFLISRLFAQEHKPHVFRSFAEDGLGRAFVNMARRATLGRFRHRRQARCFRRRRGPQTVRVIISDFRFALFHWSAPNYANTFSAFPPASRALFEARRAPLLLLNEDG